MHRFLRPALVTGRRPPADSGEGRYIRSFLFERLVVGALGLLLPFALVFLDKLAFHGSPFPRDSESAYYYSGMREWFVITLGTSGFFLIAYKVTENSLENIASLLGGLCAITIAIFPTARTGAEKSAGVPLTPLQNLLGEHPVRAVHYAASIGFVLALGGISVLFGFRESGRPPHGNRRSARFWRRFHFACAGVIGLAIVWSVVTGSIHGSPYWSLLAGETACALAFGASWFAKGFELDYLLGR